MDKKEDVQKSENKSDGNNEDNIFREKRQNRAGIVIGILAIVASVITGIFVMALKYTNYLFHDGFNVRESNCSCN